ncbi:hypothetical protein JAO76_14090 [Pontibacter sp. BT310]|uniref:hypothetical protein n=1 Tax=Pontibacter TaxID=323449 RepID=UPI0018EBAAB0|nr:MULTISPECIES: hypothetical protein [Pontibacter]MBJ6119336.1 hypothetical protein [Pontibacter sp. BT310]
MRHIPLYSRNYKFSLLNKINDFIVFPKLLQQIVKQQKVSAIVASGSLAGTLALKVWQKTKIPFYIIYEPHADYMAESNVWSRIDPRYLLQKKWEAKQLRASSGLLVVTRNYEQVLLHSWGIADAKIKLGRNPVELNKFKFSTVERNRVRRELFISDTTIVGIYVGKFGGLYYNEEAFRIYQQCFNFIPDFRLIILSPQPSEEIQQQLSNYKIDLSKTFVASVPHEQVSPYLSAADFALATYKPGPSKKYLSPVKIGEYWANGLPILLTEGIGDDSDIIKNEGGGALFNLALDGSLEKAIQQIQTIVSDPTHRQKIPQLAANYRSPEKIREAYEYFFNQLSSNGL